MRKLICGDSLEVLKTLPDQSVNCCITSPPYWGLRDYEVDGQMGLEATPQAFVSKMVAVFGEVRRVLRDDGTLWVNIGDTYVGTGSKGKHKDPKKPDGRNGQKVSVNSKVEGLPKKSLVGIPWRLAFALQDSEWVLRRDIIWEKPNAMPESVKDRPTTSHEYLFMLSKRQKYYYDGESIREPCVRGWCGSEFTKGKTSKATIRPLGNGPRNERKTRNRRSVWSIPTQPSSIKHYAMMPQKLAEPCILAGCPAGGVVLDPFCGTGTTGVVAMRHGREFVGIDLDPKAIEIAKERV